MGDAGSRRAHAISQRRRGDHGGSARPWPAWCRATRRIRAWSSKSNRWRMSGSEISSCDAGGTRRAAGARPGHRSAQCRRDPALGGRLRSDWDRHSGPPFAARGRSHRQGGVGRARARALGESRQPGAGTGRDRRAGFWKIGLAGDADTDLKDALGPSGWRWCSVPKAQACGPTRASIAMPSPGFRSATPSKA